MFFQQADGARGYWKCVSGGLGVCAETEGSTQDWSGHSLTERGAHREHVLSVRASSQRERPIGGAGSVGMFWHTFLLSFDSATPTVQNSLTPVTLAALVHRGAVGAGGGGSPAGQEVG